MNYGAERFKFTLTNVLKYLITHIKYKKMCLFDFYLRPIIDVFAYILRVWS